MEYVDEQVSELRRDQIELRESLGNIADLFGHIEKIGTSLASLKREQRTLSATTHEWLAVQSLGIDAENTRLSRFVPLRVYLSDTPGSAVEDVSRAIGSVLEAFGFQFADEFPPIGGSWYKKCFAKTTEVMTQPEVAERLEKLERALELRGLGQPQAEIDAKQAAAVAQLMKAVKDVPNAAIQAGSILLIKLSSHDGPIIQVRTLTQTELIHLENNQKLLASPGDILERLSDICRSGGQSDPIARIDGIDGKKKKKSTDMNIYTQSPQALDGSKHMAGPSELTPPDPKAEDSKSAGEVKRILPPSSNDSGTT